MDPITDKISQVASDAMGGGGILSAITSPIDTLKRAIGGAIGSLWNGVMFTGGIVAVKLGAPSLWRLILETKDKVTGSKDSAEKAALKVYDPTHRQDTGIPGVLMDSAKEGFGAAAALGAAGSVLGEGGIISKVVMVGGALVTIGALMHKDGNVKLADGSSAPAMPSATPPSINKPEKAKG